MGHPSPPPHPWTPALPSRARAPSRLAAFAGFYLPLCLALGTVGFWNSDRLSARADMLAEPERPWAQAGLDTLAAESHRARLAWIHKAMLASFPAEPIALAPLPAPAARAPGLARSAPAEPSAPPSAAQQGAPAAAPESSTPSSSSSEPAGPAKAASRIFFAGDSLANGYAAGASSALAHAKSPSKAVDHGKISTGLVSKSYFDWRARVAELCSSKPSAFVFSFGSNDPMDMREGALFVKFGSPAWEEAYSARARSVVDAAHACGSKVVWLKLPPMRDPAMARKAAVVSEAQKGACAASDACVSPFSDLGGDLPRSFAEHGVVGGKSRLLRAQDGVHMAPEGYLAVARQALEALGVDLEKPGKADKSNKADKPDQSDKP